MRSGPRAAELFAFSGGRSIRDTDALLVSENTSKESTFRYFHSIQPSVRGTEH